jgi:hypothetical protein
MSTRLGVVVDEGDLASWRRAADRQGVTLSEWVRQTLRRAVGATSGDEATRLAAIHLAAAHAFPTGDIEGLLEDIEHGYPADGPPLA